MTSADTNWYAAANNLPLGHSQRTPDPILEAHPATTQPPAAHTPAELAAILTLLGVAGASTIAIGHGRNSASTHTASAIARAWTDAGGDVLDVVDWPATAASWLRPARRLVSSRPDAWVIADSPAGFAPLARRLAADPDWTPSRTLGTASLDSPELFQLALPARLTGLSGATADGGTWRLINHLILHASPLGDPR
jgi:hypothetical protein